MNGVRRWCVVAIVAIGGCCSSQGRLGMDEPTHAARDEPEDQRRGEARALVVRASPPLGELGDYRVDSRSPGGVVLLLVGTGPVPEGGEALAELGAMADVAKIANRVGLLGAIERALADTDGSEATFSCFIQIELADAPPGDDGLRASLHELGFTAQTISGDVITGRAEISRLGALMATGWVLRLELPGVVLPR